MTKLLAVYNFELRYQSRRPWTWLSITFLMSLSFLMMRDGSFSEVLFTEFFINSPFMIAMTTVFGNLLWLLMAAFVAGEAASRDVVIQMHSLIYTTSISKLQYLGGRFLAALTVNALLLATVQIAILLAIYLPGVHPDAIGPFRAEAFLKAYLFIAIPNAFAATAIQFAFASWSGRPIAAYVGSLLLFFTAFFIASLILFKKGIGTLLDPIGVRFIWDELSHLWTSYEKSWRMLELKGTLLQNRLVWVFTGLAFLICTIIFFKFGHRAPYTFKNPFRKLISRKPEIDLIEDRTDLARNHQPRIALTPLTSGFTLWISQTLAIAWMAFRTLATSKPGVAMIIAVPLMAIPVVIDQMVALGMPVVPVTHLVIKELTGPLSADLSRWMIIPGFIIFFAGELVWQERDNNVSELTDTIPGSEWAVVTGKLLGLFLVLAGFTFMLTGAGVVAQLLMGYNNYNLTLYLKVLFGLQLPEYILFAILVFFIHTIVNQKYIGHLAAIVTYAFIAAIASMIGIEHNLLIYGAGPGWTFTEMRGFGSSLSPWAWFKLYWAGWALLLLVATALLWVRGLENSFSVRMRIARTRFTINIIWPGVMACAIIILSGSYIFYQTNIRNTYLNSSDVKEMQAEYERRYGRFETLSQPGITHAMLEIEIFPEHKAIEFEGTYSMINNGDTPIDSIHISTPTTGAAMTHLSFDKKTSLAMRDDELHYHIYALDESLRPGDTLMLRFKVEVIERGFRNQGASPYIEKRGTYFTNANWLPSVGYSRERGIVNPAERRKHGLEPRPILSALHEAHNGELAPPGRGIRLETVIGTSSDHTAVAPGSLVRQWSKNDRRYFEYVTSTSIGTEWNFFSAAYGFLEKKWTAPGDSIPSNTPVTIRIYHHPQHTKHVDHMMGGVVASLNYYSEQFGPYPYHHLTLIEHPAAPGTGMHADASLIYYGQGYANWIPPNENTLDFPYAIMGHEMGHQWTLPYAYTEGLPFLSEGIAWYYGIMMVGATREPQQTRRLMSFMRQPYPHAPIRRGEPLLRALDPYLAYKRGPLAMFALSEYAGADRVNKALHTLNQKSKLPKARPVSTLDLYRELRVTVPDSLHNLLRELFEVNTLWQFETSKARAMKNARGEWDVTLHVKARKIVYDSAGVETEIPIQNEWIPIGVFAERKDGQDELSVPLYLQKHLIQSGEQTFHVTVGSKPILAGIDPHHLLDWEEKEDDDNIEEVAID